MFCAASRARRESRQPFLKSSSQSRVTNRVVIADEFLKISSALLWKTRQFLINAPGKRLCPVLAAKNARIHRDQERLRCLATFAMTDAAR